MDPSSDPIDEAIEALASDEARPERSAPHLAPELDASPYSGLLAVLYLALGLRTITEIGCFSGGPDHIRTLFWPSELSVFAVVGEFVVGLCLVACAASIRRGLPGAIRLCILAIVLRCAVTAGETIVRARFFCDDAIIRYPHFLRFCLVAPLESIGLPVVLAWFARRQARVRASAHRCRACGYNLYGLADHRCPQCGTPFDRDTPVRL